MPPGRLDSIYHDICYLAYVLAQYLLQNLSWAQNYSSLFPGSEKGGDVILTNLLVLCYYGEALVKEVILVFHFENVNFVVAVVLSHRRRISNPSAH